MSKVEVFHGIHVTANPCYNTTILMEGVMSTECSTLLQPLLGITSVDGQTCR